MTTSFPAQNLSDDRSDAFPPADMWLDQEVAVPYEGQNRMRLVFTKGVSDLCLRVDPSETALLRGHFDGFIPSVSVAGGEVSIRYRHFGIADWLGGLLWGERVGACLALHPGVAWELVFRGGASQVNVDLRQGRLTGLEFSGGVSDLRLSLPAPDAIVPLRIRGGASDLAIRRPANVPVGVQIRGGVSDFQIDRRHIGAIGGPISLDSDGWSTAAARYDLQLTGGASDLCVTD
jgi:hypothetical protein